jgi:hypothetical protein
MPLRSKLAFVILGAVLWSAAATAQEDPNAAPVRLLGHLAGHWVMKGVIGGKLTTHDFDAEWVLNREYLRIHEVARKGEPAYEAIVFISWHKKRQEYTCMWLDSTGGGGLAPEGIALAKKSADTMPFVFVVSPTDSLHTTFSYDSNKDSWRLTIDDIDRDKTDHFADLSLTRK